MYEKEKEPNFYFGNNASRLAMGNRRKCCCTVRFEAYLGKIQVHPEGIPVLIDGVLAGFIDFPNEISWFSLDLFLD